MKCYLGSPHTFTRRVAVEDVFNSKFQGIPYVLESFFYVRSWMFPFIDNKSWNFMLDSGAFTFMSNSKNKYLFKESNTKSSKSETVDWNSYVARYADFILEHDIHDFFELDIDSVVGLSKVEDLRKSLEHRTARQCIPVWHKSRGLDNWNSLVKDYPCVAVGGIVIGEIRRSQFKYLLKLCDLAHDHACKIHGLGVSHEQLGTNRYRFDSTDTSVWSVGHRFAYVYKFTGKRLIKFSKPEGQLMDAEKVIAHNFLEWMKFQRYLLHAGWSMKP